MKLRDYGGFEFDTTWLISTQLSTGLDALIPAHHDVPLQATGRIVPGATIRMPTRAREAKIDSSLVPCSSPPEAHGWLRSGSDWVANGGLRARGGLAIYRRSRWRSLPSLQGKYGDRPQHYKERRAVVGDNWGLLIGCK